MKLELNEDQMVKTPLPTQEKVDCNSCMEQAESCLTNFQYSNFSLLFLELNLT